jgi:hypothetical protein
MRAIRAANSADCAANADTDGIVDDDNESLIVPIKFFRIVNNDFLMASP